MKMQNHVWDIVEVTLQAQNTYQNPYVEVEVWAILKGENFEKKIQGFWDGDNVFKIRMTATHPGTWTYVTDSNVADAGLNGQTGSFDAIAWEEEEKAENVSRRGIIRATANGRGLQYADGTPVYMLGDTEWAILTDRYPWFDDDEERGLGPDMGFKDVIRIRKEQGYNCVAAIAALPGWQDDGFPAVVQTEENVWLRGAWSNPKYTPYGGCKEMKNEGGFPFAFPGLVPGYENIFPNVDLVNPTYFQWADKKIDHLTANGITIFLECLRRDSSTAMKRYYQWPDTYIRFVRYIFARYHAHNCILSPVHFDCDVLSIEPEEYNAGANEYIERYGKPPFGTLLSANAHGNTLANFGHVDEARWLDMHQMGNGVREHDQFWYLTNIYNQNPPVPALNGEPYYPGSNFGNGHDDFVALGYCEEAALRTRSCIYGCLLSGGFAGYIYGCEGMWNANNEPESVWKIWDALKYKAGKQVKYVLDFIAVLQSDYTELIPDVDRIAPNKMGDALSYKGWGYCSRTKDDSEFLAFMEIDCPTIMLRGLKKYDSYAIKWFNPCTAEWVDLGQTVTADRVGQAELPAKPDNNDWGIYAVRV
ncbi:MAG: DUF5060 domain-containing protein [Faecalibacterium sp.]